MSDAINAAHAAYALDVGDADWLERLTGLVGPSLDRGRGVLGYRWRRAPSGRVEVGELSMAGGQPGDEQMLRRLIADLDPSRTSLAYGAPYSFRSLSEIARDHPTLSDLTDDRDMQRLAHGRQVVDFEMLRVDEAGGHGWMFAVLRTEVGAIPAPRRALWERVAAHVAAGARLREGLSGTGLEGAAAIYDPKTGALDVTDCALEPTDRRRRLLERIEARREAERLVRRDPLGAMELWEGLVAGRWSLLDVIDTDGRSYTVLRENPLQVRSRIALSQRERQVAFLIGRGHHVKLVAYELGLSPSTVRSHLRSALLKLNVGDQGALCRLVAGMSGGAATPVDDLGLVALDDPAPPKPDCLTGAEAEVAALVYEGLSNRDIAHRRSTAERTVANQLASIYRKLGVASRQDLIRHLAAG